MPAWPARAVNGKDAQEVSRVTIAVIGSAGSSSMPVTGASMLPLTIPVLALSRLSTIAAPSRGVSSWKVTSAGTVILHTV